MADSWLLLVCQELPEFFVNVAAKPDEHKGLCRPDRKMADSWLLLVCQELPEFFVNVAAKPDGVV